MAQKLFIQSENELKTTGAAAVAAAVLIGKYDGCKDIFDNMLYLFCKNLNASFQKKTF